MSLAVWIGIITGLAAVAQIFGVVQRRVRAVNRQDEERRRQVADLSKKVRETALLTLKMKREEKAMLAEIRGLAHSIDKGEDYVAEFRRNEEFIHVADERKGPGDQAYLAAIAHPDFGSVSRSAPEEVTRSWANGRRYLIWAATEKMARAKAAMRHPADKGFVVGAVELFAGGPEAI